MIRRWSLVGLLLGGCALAEPGPVHEVAVGPFQQVVTERGVIGSERETPVAAPFAAKLDTMVPEGTPVKAGQVVATLGVEDRQDKLERAALALEQKQLRLPLVQENARFEIWRLALEAESAGLELSAAELRLKQLVTGRDGAALVEAAEAIGQLEAERAVVARTLPEAEALLQKGYMSEEELTAMRARSASLTAELKAVRAKLAVLEAGPRKEEIALERLKVEQAASKRSGAQKRLKAARLSGELDLESARLEQARAAEEARFRRTDVLRGTIKAPAAGVVIYETVWNGAAMAKVKAGDTLRDGSKLMTISDPERQVVKAKALAAVAARLKVGLPVRCGFDAYPGLIATGKVAAVAPVAAPRLEGDLNKLPAIEVMVALDKPDGRLRPGMSANLEFVLSAASERLTVPNEALVSEPGASAAVFVLAHGRLNKRAVALGPANERVTVVTSGLEPGERVALHPPGGTR